MLNGLRSQIIGVIAALERFLADADDRGNTFLTSVLGKQHTRLGALFERHIVSISSAELFARLTCV